MSNYVIVDFDEIRKENKWFKLKMGVTKEYTLMILNHLNEELKKPHADFNYLKCICLEIISYYPFFINNYQQRFILRSRPNFNGEVFSTTKDLLYNPNPNKLGRFNLVGDPVFYCSDPVVSEHFDAALTGISESCKELFDPEEKLQYQYFTIGKFNIIKPFKVFILTQFEKAENNCPYINNINRYLRKVFENSLSSADFEICMRVYNFFSEKAATKCDNENGYLLTTAFYHAAKEYYGDELAILYSSSMTQNKGLNLVLSKELIEAKYLELELLVMYKCVRNPKNSKHYETFPCSNEAMPNKDGNYIISHIW
jgi:hypothetical protein